MISDYEGQLHAERGTTKTRMHVDSDERMPELEPQVPNRAFPCSFLRVFALRGPRERAAFLERIDLPTIIPDRGMRIALE
jgi:hypothetical protein